MAQAEFYANYHSSAGNGQVNIGSHAIKCALFLSTYSLNLLTDTLYSAISGAEAPAGTGYATGGQTLTAVGGSGSPSITTTAANSFATTWVASTAYTAGNLIRPAAANLSLYQAITTGSSAAGIPTFPTTFRGTVVDSGVTWLNVGRAITQILCGIPSWTSLTIADWRYAVFYDSVTSALIAVHDTGAKQTFASPSTLTLTPDGTGISRILTA